jgi:hypothetical protein
VQRRPFFTCLGFFLTAPLTAFAVQPNLSAITPGEVAPGTIVQLIGTDFGGNGTVHLNQQIIGADAWTDTQITLHAPALPDVYAVKVCVANECSNVRLLRVVADLQIDPTVADADNGIVVSGVKQYSDATLQSMLDASRQKLMTLQMIDQTSLASRIGAVQGANYSTSGFGLSVNGPSLPGVVTTANTGNTATTNLNGTTSQLTSGGTVATLAAQSGSTGGTSGQTNSGTSTGGTAGTGTTGSQMASSQTGTSQGTNSQLVVTGPSATNGTTGSNQAVITGPSTQTVTTQAAGAPTAAAAPATSSFTLPTGFSVSAADALQEETQLNADIEGYTLLLEGALDDHLMLVPYRDPTNPGNNRLTQEPRTRVTLGVPVDILNSGKYKDAIAEVTLYVTASENSTITDRPLITALLPTQRTYNVASIVDHSVSLGGGITTSVASVGVSWLWGHHTYYVVKDQDTVAFQLPAKATERTTQSFGWQFRPTLGQPRVTEGPREVFVQLAFPMMPTPASVAPVLGTVHVKTVWKHLDRKTNAVSQDAIPGSISDYEVPFTVYQYNLAPGIGDPDLSDNGDGTLTVRMSGPFLPGTVVQLGPNIYSDGSPGFNRTLDWLQFTVSSSDAATKRIGITDRSGAFSNVVYADTGNRKDQHCLEIKTPIPNPIPISSALIEVKLELNIKKDKDCGGNQDSPALDTRDLIALVGNKVFGLRDAPFSARTATSLSLLIPTDLLRSNDEIVVKRLFAGKAYSDKVVVDVNSVLPAVSQAVALGSTAAGTKIALIGSGLVGLKAVLPSDATMEEFNGTSAVITIPNNEMDGLKQIVLKDKTETLIMISAPTSSTDGPSIDPLPPLPVKGPTTIKITGKGLLALQSVTYNGKQVKILHKDKSFVTLVLPPEALAQAGTPNLQFVFAKNSKVDYSLSIFNQKLQVQSDTTTNK